MFKKEVFFEANDYITLKLVRKMTDIYVKGERFRYSFLLNLNAQEDDFRTCDQNNAMNDAYVNKSNFNHEKVNGTPEQEFLDHCSTMLAWVKNDYDTSMLQVKLAFPLLKKLIDAGDPQAKKVFKDEIVKQLKSSYPSTTHFLVNGKYLEYFTQKELLTLLNFCNDNLKTDALTKNKRAGFHALFFGLRRKLGLKEFEKWRDNQKKVNSSREDSLRGFIFL